MPALNDDAAAMRLSEERPALRWIILACVWLLVAALGIADTLAVRDYVQLLDDSGTLAADALPLHRPVPGPYADAQTWTRLALASDTSGAWQIRHTDIDNAPAGRDVHWNSAFIHAIAITGKARAALMHESVPSATERALAWINFPILLAVVVFFSAWMAARAGAAAGVLIALGMVGHRWFYDGFAPNNVDHHGLLTAATFGCVLGALFIPGAVSGDRAARAGTILSAICGGLGLWVSAASVVPTIAIVGFSGAVAVAVRKSSTERFEARLWRLWGRIGAAMSVAAYLIEYAPSHIGMRLEVNHPLYALAWLGGGELVAMIADWRDGGVTAPVWRRAVAGLGVVAPLAAIVVGGSHVFLPVDPALARLHGFIEEFVSLPRTVNRFGLAWLGRYAISFLLLAPALLLVRRDMRRDMRRPRLTFAAIVAVGLAALGFWQVRWWLPASGAQLCLLIVALSAIAESWSVRARWLAVAIASTVFVEQAVSRIALTRRNVADAAVTNADAMQPLYRDIAVALRRAQPTGPITLLASPDASSGISYFGGFKSIGTFYWENRDGLAAAASMLTAQSDDVALAAIRARGVTHIALLSTGNFLDAYLAFANKNAGPDDLVHTFGSRVLFQRHVPNWLRAIPLTPRSNSPSKRVLLFQVVPDQSEFDALWAQAIALAATGDDSAVVTFGRAIALVPVAQRAGLLGDAAREAYRWQAHGAALALFEASFAITREPPTALSIAWLLATSPDDRVRDGARAVALVEPLVRSTPDAGGVLDTYAAALAESGRFPDAVQAEAAAIENARRHGDAAGTTRGEERLRAYQAGRPWRQ